MSRTGDRIHRLLVFMLCMYTMDILILQTSADRYRTQGYIAVNETKTYAEAQEYCSTKYGTELATIESGEDNFQIRMTALSAGLSLAQNLWIGLSFDHSNGVWDEWDDGQRKVYSHWGPGQPNGDQTCTVMSAKYGDQWDDLECENEFYFVCNKQMEYHYYNATKMTAVKAQEYCETTYGTNLATIHRRSENDRIRDMTGYYQGDSQLYLWIGLNDMAQEGTWNKYNDGSFVTEFAKTLADRNHVSDIAWWGNEPNDAGSGEDCAHLWTDSRSRYAWNDSPCDSNEGYFACNKIVSDTCDSIQCKF